MNFGSVLKAFYEFVPQGFTRDNERLLLERGENQYTPQAITARPQLLVCGGFSFLCVESTARAGLFPALSPSGKALSGVSGWPLRLQRRGGQ